jgi:GT2 family glycosyltransferase
MDEGYFMYFEDVDYCRRVWRSGWHILYWPEARVVHLQPFSAARRAEASRTRLPAYYYASRSRYYGKFYGRSGLWLANMLWVVGRTISLIREGLGQKEPHISVLQWRDIWTNALNPMRPFQQGAKSDPSP